MPAERFDIVIIGSGAGGGTVAHALSSSAARILILERGDFVPQEDENWDPEAVWKHLRYRTKEHWLDEQGQEFLPYTHYCVGGNTKFWGSVLYRLRREDFHASSTPTASRPPGPSTTTPSNRSTSAPSACITCTDSRASIPPKRCADRFPTIRFPTRLKWRRSSPGCSARDSTLLRCRWA